MSTPPLLISAKPRSTAEIGQLTGLTTSQLANLDRNGILKPSTAGRQGVSSRYYNIGHTIAAMVVADFRRHLGIDRERQLGPIVRAIVSLPAFEESRAEDEWFHLEQGTIPWWLCYDGTDVVFSEGPPHPGGTACLSVSLETYIVQLFSLSLVQYIEPARLRLRTLLFWCGASTNIKPNDALDELQRRVLRQLAEGYLTNRIPREEAARRLGMKEKDIREDQSGWLTAQPRPDSSDEENRRRIREFIWALGRPTQYPPGWPQSDSEWKKWRGGLVADLGH